MRKIGIHFFLITILFVLAACGSSTTSSNNTITIGATAGPFSDQLQEGILPIMDEKGYSIEIVEFNDYIQPNNALQEGSIDANLYQNPNYLRNYNEENGMDLVSTFAAPTPPMSLFSSKHTSLEDIQNGMTITIPNDPVNIARSLKMLESYGWIVLDKDADPLTASEKDILENKYNLEIRPIEAAQTPRSLDDTDFAVINGNYSIASGLNLEDAVDLEETTEDYLVNLVVRKEDEASAFVQDLKEAYQSEAFLEYTNEHLKGYVKPPYQREVEEGQ